MSLPLLRLSRIAKSFGAIQALRGVSFDLLPGEVHALVGENGAGKSTLIKIITGAHQPDTGELEVENQPCHALTPAAARRLGIACIYQEPALCPDLSVAENIALRFEPVRAFRLVNWPQRRARARRLLEEIGAEISPDLPAGTLSMPEQQLVEIACVVGSGARIVLMDEPTASLTDREVDLLFKVVRGLRDRGAGVVYISHRLDEVFALADRVTVLRDGMSVGNWPLAAARSTQPIPTPKSPRGDQNLDPLHGSNTGIGAAQFGTGPITQNELIRSMIGREISLSGACETREPGQIVLAVRNLGCEFGGIAGVSFDLHSGEVLGLAGLVGAGRSELARVLFGLTPPDAGEVRLLGRRVEIRSPEQAIALGMAYVPEDRRRHGIILDLPIAANATLAVHPKLFPGGWLRLGAERDLTLDFMRRLAVRASGPEAPGRSLSGGNQQKVALARWLATLPKVLILDEPTQGVDVGAKQQIHKLIRNLAREGMAVLLISSDLSEVLELSDRIAVMRHGKLATILPGRSDPHAVMAAALGQNPEGELPCGC